MSFTGIKFDDDRWSRFLGGYRVPYDPRNALRALERGEDVSQAWAELWNERHHQGDVGDASYAAVPHLVRIYGRRSSPDWNTYALVTTIELARDHAGNPELPRELQPSYDVAWQELLEIGLSELKAAQDVPLVTSIIGVLAIAKGQRTLGRFAGEFTEDERLEMLKNADLL